MSITRFWRFLTRQRPSIRQRRLWKRLRKRPVLTTGSGTTARLSMPITISMVMTISRKRIVTRMVCTSQGLQREIPTRKLLMTSMSMVLRQKHKLCLCGSSQTVNAQQATLSISKPLMMRWLWELIPSIWVWAQQQVQRLMSALVCRRLLSVLGLREWVWSLRRVMTTPSEVNTLNRWLKIQTMV